MKHLDYCVHDQFGVEEHNFLRSKLFDVNMRLFQSSPEYRAVVVLACDYIRLCAITEKEGYKKPHGWSGANAGIPWNIVATSDGRVYINPKIISSMGSTPSLSNCGSLTLEQSIPIRRFRTVKVSFFDTEGKPQVIAGELFTLQHEIDHNNGVLITDRKI